MRLGAFALACLAAVALAVPAAVAAAADLPPPGDLVRLGEQTATDPMGAVDTVASDPVAAAENLVTDGTLDGRSGGDRAPGIGQPIGSDVADGFPVYTVAGLVAVAAAAGGFLLVTRYVSPKEALKNPQRAMIYGFVRGNPGVHLKKLSDEFAMKTSSILWHIRKLESAQLVRSERANGFRVFYPVEGGIEVKRVSRGVSALQNDNARRVFESVERNPGQSPNALGERLGIHVGTVRWHLRKLREFGLIEELNRDDGSLYFPTLLGRRTLAAMAGESVLPPPSALHSQHPLAAAVPVSNE